MINDFSLIKRGDMIQMLRLVHELREMDNDPQALRRRLLAGLCDMLKARTALCAVARPGDHGSAWDYEEYFTSGWLNGRSRKIFEDALRSPWPHHPAQGLCNGTIHSIAATRNELVGDNDWYSGQHFTKVHRPAGLDDAAYSIIPFGDGRVSLLAVFRTVGTRDRFTRRDAVILHALHGEVANLAAGESSGPTLTPRMRDMLRLLKTGAAEKEVAAELGLSRHTVHCHIQGLYRRLGVNSRAALLVTSA